MKRKRLRQMSDKRRKRIEEVREFRENLILEVGTCEVCNGTSSLSSLCVHEISNGPLREKSLDKPFAVLVVCEYCNLYDLMDKSLWPWDRQLAALKVVAPDRFDLHAFNQHIKDLPDRPDRFTEEDVDQHIETIAGKLQLIKHERDRK